MLTRRNMWNDLRSLNRMLDEMWTRPEVFFSEGGGMSPAVDVKETDGEIVVQAEMPGFSADQIDVRVENGVLYMKGNRETSQDNEENTQYHVRERHRVSFQRAFTLPAAVDVNRAEAEFENGVLTLRLPKTEESQPKRINITPRKQISASGDSGQSDQTR